MGEELSKCERVLLHRCPFNSKWNETYVMFGFFSDLPEVRFYMNFNHHTDAGYWFWMVFLERLFNFEGMLFASKGCTFYSGGANAPSKPLILRPWLGAPVPKVLKPRFVPLYTMERSNIMSMAIHGIKSSSSGSMTPPKAPFGSPQTQFHPLQTLRYTYISHEVSSSESELKFMSYHISDSSERHKLSHK